MSQDGRVSPELFSERIQVPTTHGIASIVATMIRAGDLHPGDGLPRVRDLASVLRVSPSTVSAAWTLLRERGLVTGRGKAGTWVTPPPRAATGSADLPSTATRHDLRLLLPDPQLLPRLDRALLFAVEQPGLSDYGASSILSALDAAVRTRWPFECDEFAAISGTTDGLWLILRALSVPGDRVLVESPTSPPVIRVIRRLGLIPVEFETDAAGPSPEGLHRGLKTDPIALVYQPRVHVPTGSSASEERILQLADILDRRRCMVVELDEVSDLSMAPNRTLGRHLPDRTAVIRSFEKAYGPDLRMAVIAGPASLVEGIHGHLLLERQWTSRILQGALAWLLNDPATQDLMCTAQQAYRARLRRFTTALAKAGVVIAAPDGLCAWIPVRREEAAVAYAADRGILVYPGSSSFPNGSNGFIRVATSRLKGEYEAVAAVISQASRA